MTGRRADIGVCLLLLAGTVLYLSFWPRDFYTFDEGLFLYQAKRVLDGQVMYRDFFDIITPGWFYFIALLYALFGVTLDTARMGMAVVHGLIGVLIYAICRQTGVRAPLAALAALTHLTLGYPAFCNATPHWFSTFVTLVLLAVVLRQPGPTPLHTLLWGALAGVLILVQQQKGIPVAAGVAVVIAAEQLAHKGDSVRRLVRHGAGYLAGLMLTVGPVMLSFVVFAGVHDVLRALVWHPLRNYRRIHAGVSLLGSYIPCLLRRRPWIMPWMPEGVFPVAFVIQHLPLVVPIGALAAAGRWLWSDRRTPWRPLLVTLVFYAAALASVTYNFDHVHLALVAPVGFVLAAQLLEKLLRAAESAVPPVRRIAALAALLALVGCGWQLERTVRVRRSRLPVPTPTAFGRVDFANTADVAGFRWLLERFRQGGVTEIFAYPTNAGLYLISGTSNPTRYQIILPNYTEPDQIDEVIATLEARKVPYIVRNFYPKLGELQRLNRYVAQRYEPVRDDNPDAARVGQVFRRRPEADLPALY